ncbi:MAG: dipeptidase [Clostridia bacterium]|nr:dipeptidase [Clostridia bacterium]
MPYTIFDGHCDTIQKICDSNQNLAQNQLHLSIEDMQKNQHIQVFAAFIDKKTDKLLPFNRCNQLINCYFSELNNYPEKVTHCISIQDIFNAINSKKIAALLSIEGGEALNGKLENLKYFFERGVRFITLTWNYDNEISGSIAETNTKGLTSFGKEVIKNMNNLGMVIDVSHISEQGFWDVMESTNKPVSATHSNAFSLKNHKRNLNDSQIKAIIRNNGCIGINLYSEFLSDGKCSLTDVIRHIEYILALGGENNIGFGTDFDGMDSMPSEITGIKDMEKIPNELVKLGYSNELVEKITYKNFLRLLDTVFQ